jgi:hypothetical protein
MTQRLGEYDKELVYAPNKVRYNASTLNWLEFRVCGHFR